MTAITGNTYPVKDQIKALGGRWDSDKKAWMVPDHKADEARKIVSGASASERNQESSYKPNRCRVCGVVSKPGYRGRPEPPIYRSGECQDCFEERKMGY